MPITQSERVVLVTGATGGIGEALVRQCAARGDRVAFCGRRAVDVARLERELRRAGAHVLGITCDVRDDGAVARMVRHVVRRFGPIDCAIANAGIGLPTPVLGFELAAARAVFDTNVFGVLHLFHSVVPAMVQRGEGSFVAVASLAAFRGYPGSATYSATKAAVRSFMESARLELRGTGVRTTVVHPGFVASPMTRNHPLRMPFLISSDAAAASILRAADRGESERCFPLAPALLNRVVRFLPNVLFDWFVRLGAALLLRDAAQMSSRVPPRTE